MSTAIKFLYPEVCSTHYCYQYSVYNHNRSQMYPISIEEQTRTHRWPNWVFQFLIRVTEVNVNLANHDIHKQDIMYEVTIMWEFFG